MRKRIIRRAPKKGSLKAAFLSVKEGDMRQFPLTEVNVASFRTRAGELNKAAGYSKYSVSVDNLTGTVRVMNNG